MAFFEDGAHICTYMTVYNMLCIKGGFLKLYNIWDLDGSAS